MHITIHIDDAAQQATIEPLGASPPANTSGTALAAVDEASAAAVADRTGATNAGRAPTGPDQGAGRSQASVGANAAAATWTGSTDSAGIAPTDRG